MQRGPANFLAALFKRGRIVLPITDAGIDSLSDSAKTTLIQSYVGPLTADASVAYPIEDNDQAFWIVCNDTSGGHDLLVTGESGSSSVTVGPGKSALIYADGTDLREIALSNVVSFDPASPGPIGGTTPGRGTFTQIDWSTLPILGGSATVNCTSGIPPVLSGSVTKKRVIYFTGTPGGPLLTEVPPGSAGEPPEWIMVNKTGQSITVSTTDGGAAVVLAAGAKQLVVVDQTVSPTGLLAVA
jgi:hypothetical protein